MTSWWRNVPLVLVVVGLLVACSQPAAPAPSQAQPAATSGAAAPARTTEVVLRVVIRDEPTSLDSRMYRTNEVQTFLNAGLTYHDERNVVRPLLAAKLPSRDDGSWTVNADGTMRTVYTLKPNLKWQDGEPLTAGDFAFAFQAYMDNAVPVLTRIPESFMSGVRAIDDNTLEINWKSTYVDANAMPDTALTPLPRHKVEALFQRDKQAYVDSPFWTSEEYVGAGPFRIKEWTRGLQVTATANPNFVMGRPKADVVQIRYLQDANATVAGFLAGTVDFSSYTAINFAQALTLRDQWKSDNGGRIYVSERRGGRYVEFQYRSVPRHQTAVLDRRVRAGLMHAVDRDAMAEALTGGFAPAADTFFGKQSALFPRIDAVIAKYPYDLRQTESLLGQAGWTKGADGMYRNAAGQTLDIELWITAANEDQAIIVANDWKRAGIDAHPFVVPRARNDDAEFRISYPAAFIASNTKPLMADNLSSRELPTIENAYSGGNRGSYVNREADRLYEQSFVTLDTAQRENMMVEMERIMSNDVMGHLYYLSEVAAGRAALKGPKEFASYEATYYSFNVWEWTVD